MPPPTTDAENYKTIAVINNHIDIGKIGLDWKKVAQDLGLKNARSARRRWYNVVKLGEAILDDSAAEAAGKATGGGERAPRKAKLATKRKASETEDDEEGEETSENEDEDSGAREPSGAGKGGKKRRRRAKEAKMDVKHENSENGNGAEEYRQDGQGMKSGSNVEHWLSSQVAPVEEQDHYAIQEIEQYYEA